MEENDDDLQGEAELALKGGVDCKPIQKDHVQEGRMEMERPTNQKPGRKWRATKAQKSSGKEKIIKSRRRRRSD